MGIAHGGVTGDAQAVKLASSAAQISSKAVVAHCRINLRLFDLARSFDNGITCCHLDGESLVGAVKLLIFKLLRDGVDAPGLQLPAKPCAYCNADGGDD